MSAGPGPRLGRTWGPRMNAPINRIFTLEATEDQLLEAASAALGISRSRLVRELIARCRVLLEAAAEGKAR